MPATADPVTAERTRVSQIRAAATARPGLNGLAEAAIEAAIPAAAAIAVMLAADAQPMGSQHRPIPNSEHEAKRQWNTDARLRKEFGTLARWNAYCKGATEGRCRTSGRRRAHVA